MPDFLIIPLAIIIIYVYVIKKILYPNPKAQLKMSASDTYLGADCSQIAQYKKQIHSSTEVLIEITVDDPMPIKSGKLTQLLGVKCHD